MTENNKLAVSPNAWFAIDRGQSKNPTLALHTVQLKVNKLSSTVLLIAIGSSSLTLQVISRESDVFCAFALISKLPPYVSTEFCRLNHSFPLA